MKDEDDSFVSSFHLHPFIPLRRRVTSAMGECGASIFTA